MRGSTVAGSEPNIGEGCTMSGNVRFNPCTNDRTTSVSEELQLSYFTHTVVQSSSLWCNLKKQSLNIVTV